MHSLEFSVEVVHFLSVNAVSFSKMQLCTASSIVDVTAVIKTLLAVHKGTCFAQFRFFLLFNLNTCRVRTSDSWYSLFS